MGVNAISSCAQNKAVHKDLQKQGLFKPKKNHI